MPTDDTTPKSDQSPLPPADQTGEQNGQITPATKQTTQTTPSADQTIPTNPELEKLKQELKDAKKQIEALTLTAKRALADLDNFRRRSKEEKGAFIEFANAKLILELLPVADNFKRAFEHIPVDLQNNDWIKGVTQIEKQLIDFLEKQGLKEIKALGQPFNANYHEALMQGPGSKDQIIEVFERGYLLGQRVLRPAKVKVGQGENN